MVSNSLRRLSWAGAFLTCAAMTGAAAEPAAVPTTRTAILPNADAAAAKATFTLSSTPSAQSGVSLSFDVRAIPITAAILSAKLRIVPCRGGPAPTSPQEIRIFGGGKSSIGQLLKGRDERPIESVGDGLKAAVSEAVRARTVLKLDLKTESRTPTQTYYLNVAKKTDDPACTGAVAPEDRPRLIVETRYGDSIVRDGGQLRYRDRTLDATPWKHDLSDSAKQNAVVVSETTGALGLDTISAGPAFIGEQILLIAKPKAPQNSQASLYAVGWNGARIWQSPLPQLTDVKVWKYIIADDQDRLLAFASDSKIRVYPSLGGEAPAAAPLEKTITDMNLAESPLLTMGGMIVYRSVSTVYVLSPLGGQDKDKPPNGWEPLVQFGFAGQPQAAISPWSREDLPPTGQPQTAISPWSGENLLYVTPVDEDRHRSGIFVFDPARGVQVFPPEGKPRFPDLDLNKGSELSAFADYNPLQVLARDPGKDLALLSGSGNSSSLWAYWGLTSNPPGGWRRSAESISSCIASPPDGAGKTFLYCVDGSATKQKFRKLDVSDGKEICLSTLEGELKPSSNLVADGAGNVFFWVGVGGNAGFYGFDAGCRNILFSELSSAGRMVLPNGKLDLHVGPNGVFYLTDSTRLIAIEPVRKSSSISELAGDTRYASDGDLTIQAKNAPAGRPVILAATGGKLALESLQIPKGADVTCSGRAGVTFGNGFRVEKGGVLRCGIDNSSKLISQ